MRIIDHVSVIVYDVISNRGSAFLISAPVAEMSAAESQPASEAGCEPLEKIEDVSVGMRVEAKDSYGKW